jgi:hypothetical protein
MEAPVDDYVMVMDCNVGATKGDFVKKSAQMRVEVTQSGLSKQPQRINNHRIESSRCS